MNKLTVSLAAILLLMTAMAWQRPRSLHFDDVHVYQTAGALVASHRGGLIYEGADSGIDPQLRFADERSPFAQQARALGIPRVRLYVYPPLLADLMAPFALLSAHAMDEAWLGLNALWLAAAVLLLAGLLAVPLGSPAFAALLLAALTQYPTWHAVVFGQVTILLLALVAAALDFYRRGWLAASAAMLALATAIKLTPLLIALPFLLWGEWRWLRAFAAWLAALALLLCNLNGASVVFDYFLRVIPPMTSGVVVLSNKSLPAAIQLFCYVLGHGRLGTHAMPASGAAAAVARLLCFGILLGASLLVFHRRRTATLADRILTLALFALLSICLAPVSWRHAYVVQLLPFALLWKEMLERGGAGPQRKGGGAWLVFATVEMGTCVFDSLGIRLLPPACDGLLALFAPLTGVTLVLTGLARIPVRDRELSAQRHILTSAARARPSSSSS